MSQAVFQFSSTSVSMDIIKTPAKYVTVIFFIYIFYVMYMKYLGLVFFWTDMVIYLFIFLEQIFGSQLKSWEIEQTHMRFLDSFK